MKKIKKKLLEEFEEKRDELMYLDILELENRKCSDVRYFGYKRWGLGDNEIHQVVDWGHLYKFLSKAIEQAYRAGQDSN